MDNLNDFNEGINLGTHYRMPRMRYIFSQTAMRIPELIRKKNSAQFQGGLINKQIQTDSPLDVSQQTNDWRITGVVAEVYAILHPTSGIYCRYEFHVNR